MTVEKANKVHTVIPGAGKFLDAMSSKFVAVIFGALIVAGLAVVSYDISRDKSQQSPKRVAVPQAPRKQQAAQPVRTAQPGPRVVRPARAVVAPTLFDQGPKPSAAALCQRQLLQRLQPQLQRQLLQRRLVIWTPQTLLGSHASWLWE